MSHPTSVVAPFGGEPPAGYHGRYLRIDVSSGDATVVPLDERVLRRYLGGAGLGTWIALREGAAEADPFSPAAAIAFVFSPLVGSPLTTSAKFAVVSRSPLTDRLNDSLSSSGFALAGKKTGFDALVIVGRAAGPSLVVIDDGVARVVPAGELWGTACGAAEEALRVRFPGDWQFAVIGPAGERLVRYATISHAGRHAGRGGSGAVLGAKNIKAVVVRGTHRCRWAQPEALAAYSKRLSDRSLGPATAKYRELGTVANLVVFNRLHALPTRNFQLGSSRDAQRFDPESLAAEVPKVRASCVACTIGCEHIYGAPGKDTSVRLEYESLFALGPLCDIHDPHVVLAAAKRCDDWGQDTISTGGTIAMAMESVERGWLDAPWLRFGDGEALLRAIDEIGRRTGLGDRLAEGSRRLAAQLGPGAMAIAPHVKGLEIPGYEPRALQTMALGLAVGTRGADHNRSSAYEVDFSERVDRRELRAELAAPLAVETEDKAALIDSLILCKFLRGVFADLWSEAAHMMSLVTGWDLTAEELRATARRVMHTKKWFNIRAGWQPAEDTLPPRFLAEPLADDAQARLSAEQLSAAIRGYNRCRGWSDEGWLRDETVAELSEP